jgi:hypothetical protein
MMAEGEEPYFVRVNFYHQRVGKERRLSVILINGISACYHSVLLQQEGKTNKALFNEK